jgi:hypothetical protein
MAVSRATFLAEYPEFTTADVTLVDAKIADAVARTSALLFDADTYDRRVYLLAAKLLAKSPLGRDARLSLDDGSTIYDAEIDRMDRVATCGMRVC